VGIYVFSNFLKGVIIMSAKQTHDKLAAKKAAVIGSSSKSRTPLWAGLACVAMLAAGAFWYFSAGSATSPVAPAAVAAVAGKTVSMPAALFDDGKAHYYEHKDGNIAIRYFVLKSSDGVIRAAFDACDVCWRAGKGYAQDGDFMVCGNCGQRFKSTKVNEVKGGCNPAPLDRRLENGTVVIQVSDILGGKGYFDYSKKG
jgi:uncharacterized membrane protein